MRDYGDSSFGGTPVLKTAKKELCITAFAVWGELWAKNTETRNLFEVGMRIRKEEFELEKGK